MSWPCRHSRSLSKPNPLASQRQHNLPARRRKHILRFAAPRRAYYWRARCSDFRTSGGFQLQQRHTAQRHCSACLPMPAWRNVYRFYLSTKYDQSSAFDQNGSIVAVSAAHPQKKAPQVLCSRSRSRDLIIAQSCSSSEEEVSSLHELCHSRKILSLCRSNKGPGISLSLSLSQSKHIPSRHHCGKAAVDFSPNLCHSLSIPSTWANPTTARIFPCEQCLRKFAAMYLSLL